jgi:hypothetical protein
MSLFSTLLFIPSVDQYCYTISLVRPILIDTKYNNKLRVLSPRANYTNRATALVGKVSAKGENF